MKRNVKLLTVLFFALSNRLLAGGAGSLPWDSVMQKWQASLTGPVAVSVGGVGFMMCGAMLVFGHDWGQFAKSALLCTLAVCFLVLSDKFLVALGVVGGLV